MRKINYKKVIKLKTTDYINKAFKILPSNAFIHKGRCGIGGTTLELETKRNSIIVAPTTGIIDDKSFSTDEYGNIKYPDLFTVYGNIKPKDIIPYLQSDKKDKKIFVTPDSLYKIIEAAKEAGLLEELYNDYFLLYDESHSIITEDFREKMIEAYNLQFEFKQRTFISATPYYFSDPRLKNLDYYKITFDEPLGKINIIDARSVKECLNAFLTEKVKVKGNVHIFFNSVTEIGEAIEYAELQDCNIYVAEKDENLEKLGNAAKFYVKRPITGEYKKFNFYTTKYFEGWDLFDTDATIILVTDVYKPHTQVGITNKGVQAIGRLRFILGKPETKPFAVYHITNHRYMEKFKTIDEFEKNFYFEATWEAESFNLYMETCKEYGFEPDTERIKNAKKYTEFDSETGLVKVCSAKIDQFINNSACDEEFNHIDYIKRAWEGAGFEADIHVYKQTAEKDRQRKTTKSVQEILSDFEALDPQNVFIFHTDADAEKLSQLKTRHPLIYKAYKNLTKEEIESTKFNIKVIEKLLILKENKDAEIAVMKLLPLYFTVGRRYTKSAIKSMLQDIYDKTGFNKTATAEQLRSMDWYETKSCKIKNNNEEYENGFEILRMKFKLKVSAK